MPYFGSTYGGKLQEQVGLRPDGSSMPIDEFVDVAEAAAIAPDELPEASKPTAQIVTLDQTKRMAKSGPSSADDPRAAVWRWPPRACNSLAEEKMLRRRRAKTTR